MKNKEIKLMYTKNLQIRRDKLLKRISTLINEHEDPVPLKDISPEIGLNSIIAQYRPTKYKYKFTHSESASIEIQQDAKDLKKLLNKNLIEIVCIEHNHSKKSGQINCKEYGVKITNLGEEYLIEYDKNYFIKAIEKQPVTYWQVILTIMQILVTISLALFLSSKKESSHKFEKIHSPEYMPMAQP